jgi:hypothetical protein
MLEKLGARIQESGVAEWKAVRGGKIKIHGFNRNSEIEKPCSCSDQTAEK